MSAYNFLDPNQVNEFKVKAKASGRSYGETQAYINNKQREQMSQQKMGLDIQKQQVEGMKVQRDLLNLQSGSVGSRDLPAAKATELSDIKNSIELLDNLSETVSTSGEFGQIRGRIGMINPLDTGAKTVQAQTLQAAQIIGRALEGGKLAEGDIARYQKMLPQTTDSSKVAQNKIDLLKSTLEAQYKGKQEGLSSAGFDVGEQLGVESEQEPETPQAFNMLGEVAKKGDLIRNNETGDLSHYGMVDQRPAVFKTTSDGGDVDGGLVQWLSDSEFLPIAGSVVGSILGGTGSGIASLGLGTAAGGIAGGVAGATIGKSMQQGLRELLNPEEQDLSDMAQAVVIEGVTDGILGGAMFGVGAVAKPAIKGVAGKVGLKILLGEGAETAVKQMGKEAVSETAEAGVKTTVKEGVEEGFNKKTRDLVARGLEINPKAEQKAYANKTGGRDIVADIMERYGIPKPGGKELQEVAQKDLKASSAKLTNILKGKTAKTADVIADLEKIQYKTMTEGAEFKAGLEPASNLLDKYITEIRSAGDEIPLQELNSIKLRLQKAFPVGSGVTKSSTKLVEQESATVVKEFIEKFHPEIEGTNRAKQLSYMAMEIGEKLNQKKAKSFWQFGDLPLGVINPPLLIGKKAFDAFGTAFSEPLTQAKMLNSALQMASANGNKQGVRNTLRFASKLGISFGVSPNAVSKGVQGAVSGAGASAVSNSMAEPQPGLDLEQPEQPQDVQPGFMYR